jgi:hypothetical protein
MLLLERHATVTICHSRTRDLAAVCARADVLIAAVGVPRMIGADHGQAGAAVIDVGINRLEDGLAGDVDFEAVKDRAGLLTPVPGRRGTDDDRDVAAEYRARGPRPAGLSGSPGGNPVSARPIALRTAPDARRTRKQHHPFGR